MTYTYKLISTGGSSVKYGDCEVCKHPATEMFHQTEELIYERDGRNIQPDTIAPISLDMNPV